MAQRREVVGRACTPGPVQIWYQFETYEQRGDDVAAQLAERRTLEQRRPDGEREQHHEQRRQQTAGPPDPELLHVDAWSRSFSEISSSVIR